MWCSWDGDWSPDDKDIGGRVFFELFVKYEQVLKIAEQQGHQLCAAERKLAEIENLLTSDDLRMVVQRK